MLHWPVNRSCSHNTVLLEFIKRLPGDSSSLTGDWHLSYNRQCRFLFAFGAWWVLILSPAHRRILILIRKWMQMSWPCPVLLFSQTVLFTAHGFVVSVGAISAFVDCVWNIQYSGKLHLKIIKIAIFLLLPWTQKLRLAECSCCSSLKLYENSIEVAHRSCALYFKSSILKKYENYWNEKINVPGLDVLFAIPTIQSLLH